MSSFTARMPHAAYRPRLRPAGEAVQPVVPAPGWLQLLPACVVRPTATVPASLAEGLAAGGPIQPAASIHHYLLVPAAGEQARLWWRYAFKAVQQQVLARKLTWEQAIKVCSPPCSVPCRFWAEFRESCMRWVASCRSPH